MTEQLKQKLNDSKVLRWSVLALVAFTMLCGYFLTDVMSPLKPMLEKELLWDSLDYGFFTSAYGWFNVFLLMLIFGGIILDKMGVRFTALLSGGVMLIGAVIKWYAVAEGFKGSGLEAWFTNNLNYIPVFDGLWTEILCCLYHFPGRCPAFRIQDAGSIGGIGICYLWCWCGNCRYYRL